MGLCVLEGNGGSSGIVVAKEKWRDANIAYVDKRNVNCGSTAGTITVSLSDVLPVGKTLLFATLSVANSQRGGDAYISAVSGQDVSITKGYSYSDGVYLTIRGYYLVDSLTSPFEIKNVKHAYNIGNQVGDGRDYIDVDWCTLDTLLPTDAVIVGYGFYSLSNRTGNVYIKDIINRTPIVSVGYSYNDAVRFTIEAFYI